MYDFIELVHVKLAVFSILSEMNKADSVPDILDCTELLHCSSKFLLQGCYTMRCTLVVFTLQPPDEGNLVMLCSFLFATL